MKRSLSRMVHTVPQRFLMLAALLCGIAIPGSAQVPLPERLLTPADLEHIGIKGAVRPSAEMYNPAEGLHFIIGRDSALVLTVGALEDARTPGELRAALELVVNDLKPVTGVGDEAYAGLGGWMLAFRKGTKTFQLLTGVDVANGARVFLTPAQLADLARTIAGRL